MFAAQTGHAFLPKRLHPPGHRTPASAYKFGNLLHRVVRAVRPLDRLQPHRLDPGLLVRISRFWLSSFLLIVNRSFGLISPRLQA